MLLAIFMHHGNKVSMATTKVVVYGCFYIQAMFMQFFVCECRAKWNSHHHQFHLFDILLVLAILLSRFSYKVLRKGSVWHIECLEKSLGRWQRDNSFKINSLSLSLCVRLPSNATHPTQYNGFVQSFLFGESVTKPFESQTRVKKKECAHRRAINISMMSLSTQHQIRIMFAHFQWFPMYFTFNVNLSTQHFLLHTIFVFSFSLSQLFSANFIRNTMH